MIGFATIGIITDFVFKGKYLYTIIISIHITSLILLSANIIYLSIKGKNLVELSNFYFYVYGYLTSTGWVLIFIVLPLFITAKEREKHSYWEIPMAA